MARVRLGNKTIELPGNRMARMGLGILLLLGGVLWFLPVLGIWMIPLGFLVLAADSHAIRRFNRRFVVLALGWWNRRKPHEERKAERRKAHDESPAGGQGGGA